MFVLLETKEVGFFLVKSFMLDGENFEVLQIRPGMVSFQRMYADSWASLNSSQVSSFLEARYANKWAENLFNEWMNG